MDDDESDEEIASPPDLNRTATSHSADNEADAVVNRWEHHLCSILNLVVDYSMELATAAFESSESLQVQQQLVPVLRVFGPLIRHQRDRRHRDPLQSACLYIHNAFPYMIARPVRAGMDGRPERATCPWNSATAVRHLTEGIQDALETQLSSSSYTFADTTATTTTAAASRLIREITVVQGRGFYTYCDGPIAPFLRVEYYNPADRWKVKRCLEQGLKDLPMAIYHPATGNDLGGGDDNDDEEDPLLTFHCFEAHIPYTMQFFKDYNLSGMSYIHLDACQLREPLPAFHPQAAANDGDNSVVFLAHNTPAALRQTQWRKQTSCALELDADVTSILNVLDVMTEAPSSSSSEQVHWRAVPSLRDIWMQERRRMAKLLDPPKDFLNFPAQDTNDDRTQPGARVAAEGMQRLVRLTPGLHESFQRVMRDIVARHARGLEARERDTSNTNTPRGRQKNEHPQSLLSESTPTHSQTVALLETIDESSSQRTGDAPIDAGQGVQNDPTLDDDVLDSAKGPSSDILGEVAQRPRKEDRDAHPAFDSTPLSLPCQQHSQQSSGGRYEAMSQTFYSQGHRNDPLDLDDEALTQRIDRGDGVVNLGPFLDAIEDVIDPATLAPYDTVDDENSEGADDEELDEDEFEQQLETMATQTLPTAHESHLQPADDDVSSDASSVDSLELLTNLKGGEVAHGSHSESAHANLKGADQSIGAKPSHVKAKAWQHEGDMWLVPEKTPPKRRDLVVSSRQTMLYPMPAPGEIPPWMPSLSKLNHPRRSVDWFPPTTSGGHDIKPLRPPVSYNAVLSWSRRRHQNVSRDSARKKPIGELRSKDTVSRLRIDENSFKIVADNTNEKTGFGVEAVVLDSRNGEEEDDSVSQHIDVPEDTKPSAALTSGSLPPTSSSMDEATGSNSIPSQLGTPSGGMALDGMANQGGRLLVEGGGELKAKTKLTQLTQRKGKPDSGQRLSDSLSCPVSILSIEIFVHCRTGKKGLNNSSSTMALTADPERDRILSVCFVHAR